MGLYTLQWRAHSLRVGSRGQLGIADRQSLDGSYEIVLPPGSLTFPPQAFGTHFIARRVVRIDGDTTIDLDAQPACVIDVALEEGGQPVSPPPLLDLRCQRLTGDARIVTTTRTESGFRVIALGRGTLELSLIRGEAWASVSAQRVTLEPERKLDVVFER